MTEHHNNSLHIGLKDKSRLYKIKSHSSSHNCKEDVKVNIKAMQTNFENHIALIRRKYNHSLSKLMQLKSKKYRRNSMGFDIKEVKSKAFGQLNDSQDFANSHKNNLSQFQSICEDKRLNIQSLQIDDPYKVMGRKENDMNLTNIELENVTFKNGSSSSKHRKFHGINNMNNIQKASDIRNKIIERIGCRDIRRRLNTMIKDYEPRDKSK